MKMTRKQIVAKINELWATHEACITQHLDRHGVKVLDALAKFLNMPRHVRIALNWGYTRTMIGSLTTDETLARERAYGMAYTWILSARDMHEPTSANTADLAFYRRRLAQCEGACAGYLFAAKERIET